MSSFRGKIYTADELDARNTVCGEQVFAQLNSALVRADASSISTIVREFSPAIIAAFGLPITPFYGRQYHRSIEMFGTYIPFQERVLAYYPLESREFHGAVYDEYDVFLAAATAFRIHGRVKTHELLKAAYGKEFPFEYWFGAHAVIGFPIDIMWMQKSAEYEPVEIGGDFPLYIQKANSHWDYDAAEKFRVEALGKFLTYCFQRSKNGQMFLGNIDNGVYAITRDARFALWEQFGDFPHIFEKADSRVSIRNYYLSALMKAAQSLPIERFLDVLPPEVLSELVGNFLDEHKKSSKEVYYRFTKGSKKAEFATAVEETLGLLDVLAYTTHETGKSVFHVYHDIDELKALIDAHYRDLSLISPRTMNQVVEAIVRENCRTINRPDR